jgi:nitrate reductase / nitrite oxidoreductase, beta subunit
VRDMHRLLAVAKYDERYVIPTAHSEQGPEMEELDTGCSLDYEEGPGMGGWGPFGETSGGVTPIAVENFHMLATRQLSDTPAAPPTKQGRVNLLNWDGKGAPEGLFPSRTRPTTPTEGPPGGVSDDDPATTDPKP